MRRAGGVVGMCGSEKKCVTGVLEFPPGDVCVYINLFPGTTDIYNKL